MFKVATQNKKVSVEWASEAHQLWWHEAMLWFSFNWCTSPSQIYCRWTAVTLTLLMHTHKTNWCVRLKLFRHRHVNHYMTWFSFDAKYLIRCLKRKMLDLRSDAATTFFPLLFLEQFFNFLVIVFHVCCGIFGLFCSVAMKSD